MHKLFGYGIFFGHFGGLSTPAHPRLRAQECSISTRESRGFVVLPQEDQVQAQWWTEELVADPAVELVGDQEQALAKLLTQKDQ